MIRNLAGIFIAIGVALGVACIAILMIGGALAVNIWLWHLIFSVIF